MCMRLYDLISFSFLSSFLSSFSFYFHFYFIFIFSSILFPFLFLFLFSFSFLFSYNLLLSLTLLFPHNVGQKDVEVRIMADAFTNYFRHLLRRNLSELITKTTAIAQRGNMTATQIQVRTVLTVQYSTLYCLSFTFFPGLSVFALISLKNSNLLMMLNCQRDIQNSQEVPINLAMKNNI